MIVLGFCLVFTLVLVLIVLSLAKKKIPKDILALYQKTMLYISINLDLDESILFIDITRKLNMSLIEYTKDLNPTHPLKKVTHELLGLILKTPRMNESSEKENIMEAIKQISAINETAEELQEFFKDHKKVLEQYLK